MMLNPFQVVSQVITYVSNNHIEPGLNAMHSLFSF